MLVQPRAHPGFEPCRRSQSHPRCLAEGSGKGAAFSPLSHSGLWAPCGRRTLSSQPGDSPEISGANPPSGQAPSIETATFEKPKLVSENPLKDFFAANRHPDPRTDNSQGFLASIELTVPTTGNTTNSAETHSSIQVEWPSCLPPGACDASLLAALGPLRKSAATPRSRRPSQAQRRRPAAFAWRPKL